MFRFLFSMCVCLLIFPPTFYIFLTLPVYIQGSTPGAAVKMAATVSCLRRPLIYVISRLFKNLLEKRLSSVVQGQGRRWPHCSSTVASVADDQLTLLKSGAPPCEWWRARMLSPPHLLRLSDWWVLEWLSCKSYRCVYFVIPIQQISLLMWYVLDAVPV